MPALEVRRRARSLTAALVLALCGGSVQACAADQSQAAGPSPASHAGEPAHKWHTAASAVLPEPAKLALFNGGADGQGSWLPAGRPVRGFPAVFETTLVPPGGSAAAGLAWMDTRLLVPRLYSGSVSPGRGRYDFTAPIQPAQAATLVAAFNGGFEMKDARGGYYTDRRVVFPLRPGAASLVFYADGSVGLGAWDRDVRMTPLVVSVRQNLVPLVADGHPAAAAAKARWQAWGSTCGANSCAASVPGIKHQWRSGLGITANGALVYAVGPALDPPQLAWLLIRAGAIRGMELDINPYWPTFVSYDPSRPTGPANPANGQRLLASTVQGPATFFTGSWGRDFITLSAK